MQNECNISYFHCLIVFIKIYTTKVSLYIHTYCFNYIMYFNISILYFLIYIIYTFKIKNNNIKIMIFTKSENYNSVSMTVIKHSLLSAVVLCFLRKTLWSDLSRTTDLDLNPD